MGIISPIYNATGCSSNGCHVHEPGKKVLGALDVVISLERADKEILFYENGIMAMAMVVFVLVSGMIFLFILRFVNRPIRKLIDGTVRIENGQYDAVIDIGHEDEMGQLAAAISHMGAAIGEKQKELNRQKDEYQELFELVPCIMSVQDRNYRLISYNRQFAEMFEPCSGDFCYSAYKGRTEKCPDCPVEKTFADGQSHYSEETGYNKDGSPTHWIVKTAPLKNSDGEIVAAMEMSLDITHRKRLEERLEKSERKYQSMSLRANIRAIRCFW